MMMKKINRLFSAFMIVLCIFLTACGSSASSTPVGSYVLDKVSAEGESDAAEQFEMMKESGLSATLDLNEDGTGLLNMFGTAINVTWNKDAKTIGIYGQDLEYTFENKAFTFTWDNTKLEFTKAEE